MLVRATIFLFMSIIPSTCIGGVMISAPGEFQQLSILENCDAFNIDQDEDSNRPLERLPQTGLGSSRATSQTSQSQPVLAIGTISNSVELNISFSIFNYFQFKHCFIPEAPVWKILKVPLCKN